MSWRKYSREEVEPSEAGVLPGARRGSVRTVYLIDTSRRHDRHPARKVPVVLRDGLVLQRTVLREIGQSSEEVVGRSAAPEIRTPHPLLRKAVRPRGKLYILDSASHRLRDNVPSSTAPFPKIRLKTKTRGYVPYERDVQEAYMVKKSSKKKREYHISSSSEASSSSKIAINNSVAQIHIVKTSRSRSPGSKRCNVLFRRGPASNRCLINEGFELSERRIREEKPKVKKVKPPKVKKEKPPKIKKEKPPKVEKAKPGKVSPSTSNCDFIAKELRAHNLETQKRMDDMRGMIEELKNCICSGKKPQWQSVEEDFSKVAMNNFPKEEEDEPEEHAAGGGMEEEVYSNEFPPSAAAEEGPPIAPSYGSQEEMFPNERQAPAPFSPSAGSYVSGPQGFQEDSSSCQCHLFNQSDERRQLGTDNIYQNRGQYYAACPWNKCRCGH